MPYQIDVTKLLLEQITELLKAGPILEVVSIDDLLAAGELPTAFAGRVRTDLLHDLVHDSEASDS